MSLRIILDCDVFLKHFRVNPQAIVASLYKELLARNRCDI